MRIMMIVNPHGKTFNLKIAVDVKCACGLGIAFRGTARA